MAFEDLGFPDFPNDSYMQEFSNEQLSQLVINPMLGFTSATHMGSTAWEWSEHVNPAYQSTIQNNLLSSSTAESQSALIEPLNEEQQLRHFVSEFGHRMDRLEGEVEHRIAKVEEIVKYLQNG
jgi:hypothetical protein